MDHNEIENLDFVERYLMGGLTPGEIDRFEEHFVACPQCVEQLRTTDNFIKGIRLVAAEQAVSGGWFFSRFATHHLILASIGLVILIIAGSWIFIREMRLRSEVDDANAQVTRLISANKEKDENARMVSESARSFQEHLKSDSAKIDDLNAKVAAQNDTIKSLMAEAHPTSGLIADLQAFRLRAEERSVSANFKPSVIELKKPTPPLIKISFALEVDNDLEEYCVSAFNAAGVRIVKQCGLSPMGSDIVLLIYSAGLKSGAYRFEIVGRTDNGAWKDIETYYATVTRSGSRKR